MMGLICCVCVCLCVCPQVLQLRADLATLQATNSQANAIASAEVDTALNSVSHKSHTYIHTHENPPTHNHRICYPYHACSHTVDDV